MDGDEPLLEPGPSSILPPEPVGTPTPPPPPPLPRGGAGAPPPLPPKLPQRTGAFRPASPIPPSGPATPARSPAAQPMPAPLAGLPSSLAPLPASPARPEGDPFGEPAEARPPRSGSPDEKVEFFRHVVKQKSETLARARQVYQERDAEAEALRTLATQWRAQLETALGYIHP